jgi:membrane-associated protease RseP (regulator of RpoE activity)
MTSLVYALGVVLFLAGVLISIALHEVGHMVPAKKFGVKVTQYFVGFGTTVWSVRRGDTEYGVKAFPLGGFIKLVGMLPPERRDENGRVKGISRGFFGRLIADARALEYRSVTPADEPRLFYRLAWWKKIVVMAGGPMTNVVLAVLLLGGVFMGIGVKSPTLVVSAVSDCVIPASEGARACVVAPHPHPDPVSPARKAGFHVGDKIVSFNGQPMSSWDEFSAAIRANGAQRATVVVQRAGKDVTLTTKTMVSQRPSLDLNTTNSYVNVGFLGVTPDEVRQRQGPGYVSSTMWDYTKRTGVAVVHMPQRMVGVVKAAFGLEKRDPQSPMSVVGASRIAGDVASDNQISVTDRWATLLMLLGVVNLFVALFNFIPLLPLDGGHIAGALFEAIRRGLARVRGRPDPGYADVAQLLPFAYALASVLIVMGVLLIWADIVNPITLSG